MKILFFANTGWYLYNFRLPLARYLRDQGHEVVMLSPPDPYVTHLQAAGFRTVTLPMERRSLNPVRELRLLQDIRRIYAQERPDLVHHFTLKCVVYGALVARPTGVPACVNAITGLGHVFTSTRLSTRLLRGSVRLLLRLVLNSRRSRLIVQNPDDQAAFEQTGLMDSQSIRLIRSSGVDTERFQPVAKPIPTGRLSILLASRLLWEKGIGEYVAAARQLRREGLAAEFLVAGAPDPGNPASIPADQLAQWRREGYVTLLGHVDDMPALLAQTDIAVLPSYREGVPRSLLEAAACGLPLIATDVPGCREIVDHGVNGLLVPLKDAQSLTHAVRRLYEDAPMRQRMGQASRAKVLAEFDQRLVFEQTLAVYRELRG
ncbi:MAG TPA: glycosyltransferase family 1 protein [Gammaproteobacteria bacterium]|nr:glycosyltransferase family 1 protein [Gammaproteobacteria bacterium]